MRLNCLSTWFPVLERSYVPVPKTIIVTTEQNLSYYLDEAPRTEGTGTEDAEYGRFCKRIQQAIYDIGGAESYLRGKGPAVFLRTGHTSGKHDWKHTCALDGISLRTIQQHIGALVEYSDMADIIGLPTNVWAVREFLPTEAAFTAQGYAGMPVTRERRYFVRGASVEAHFPYWPKDAVEQGRPDVDDWEAKLAAISDESAEEVAYLTHMSAYVGACMERAGLGGYWSVDWLWVPSRGFYCTDMAQGDHSWRPDR